jgi:Tectonin domain
MQRSKETTMKNQTAKSLAVILVLMLGTACVQSATAQTFKRVKVKGGVSLVQVAAGTSSVWAVGSNRRPYIYQNGRFERPRAHVFLTQITVGGGSAVQPDTVWGLDSAGGIYGTLYPYTRSFYKVPGVLDFIAVGPGYSENCHPYEVWGLNAAAQIFRYNYCSMAFEQEPGTLGSLAVGGGAVWGINGNGEIFRFNFTTLVFDQLPGFLTQITAGPNGIWGLFGTQIYQFSDNIQNFFQLPGSLTHIQAGGNGVWGLDSSGAILRLEPSTGSFVQIPGTLGQISVGNGGGVWGINSLNQTYTFSTP